MSYWPELRETLVAAAHREYGAPSPAGPPATSRRWVPPLRLPRLSSVAVLVASLTAIAVAVVALTVLRHSPQSTSSSASGPPLVSKSEAWKIAEQTLRQLVLPAGAVRSGLHGGVPADLWFPASLIETPQRVDSYGVWLLPESPARVISFIQAHRPAGSSVRMLASTGEGPTPSKIVLTQASFAFSFRGDARTTIWQQLAVQVDGLPHGGSILRADGEAGWLYPRSSLTQIPAAAERVRVVTFNLGAPGPARRKRTTWITSSTRIATLIGLLDALPAAPPTALDALRRSLNHCAGDGINFSFYYPHGRRPVAITEYLPSCGILLLRISPPQLNGGGFFPLALTSQANQLRSFAPKPG